MGSKAKLRIALDVSRNSIKLISCHAKEKPKLHHLAVTDFIADGIVQHPHDISDTHIASGITDLLKEVPYRKASIRVCLSATMNNLFIIDIPQVGKHEIKQALFWELGPLLPESVSKYEYDYKVITQSARKKRMTVLVGAMSKERVSWILKVFKALGKKVDILETDILPALDLFAIALGKLNGTVGFLQLGAGHSNYVLVTPDSTPSFLHIPFGGNLLSEKIAKTHGISFAVAEDFRHKKGGNGKPDTKCQTLLKDDDSIANSLRDLAGTIIQFNLHQQQKIGQTASKIYVTGGLLSDRSVAETLTQSPDCFQVPCEFWDPLASHLAKDEIERRYRYRFASALGLAMR